MRGEDALGAAALVPEAPHEVGHPVRSFRVLVVDDEPLLRRAYRRVLQQEGAQVDEAGDVGSAVSMIGQKQFEVVVTDVRLPDGDGRAVLAAVRARDPETPVLVVSGEPHAVEGESAATYVLPKPLDGAQLAAAVRNAKRMRDVARLQHAASNFHAQHAAAERPSDLESRFHRAVDSLWVAFQPIVSSSERRVVAYEALARTEEPSLSRPNVLFDAAAALGESAKLGRLVREVVAASIDDAPLGADVFVNLTIFDLLDEELYSPSSALALRAPRVVLEITEQCALSGMTDLKERVAALRELGFRIALDDLGAGYASLATFVELSPDVVKLDISLVRDIDRDPTKQNLVRTIYALCVDLGMVVIAEGVETIEERDTLHAMGALLLQGFFFGRPGSPFPRVDFHSSLPPPMRTENELAPSREQRLTNLSHELLTPLNAIVGFTQLLFDGKAGVVSRTQHEMLGEVLASCHRLSTVVREILEGASEEREP